MYKFYIVFFIIIIRNFLLHANNYWKFINGSAFGKRDLLAIFHIMKYDVKCGTCLHKFDCRENTLSNAANHLIIFLIVCINICTSCTLGIPYSQLLSLFLCHGSLKLTFVF